MRILFFFILFLSVCAAQAQKRDTLTNKTVISLYSAHLGSETIKAKIQGSPCVFDLSTDGLINLKKAGLPDDVITAMVAKGEPKETATATAVAPGLYYSDSATHALLEMESSVMANAKTGGFGEAMQRKMTKGFMQAKIRATIDGASAQLKVGTKPVFQFVFDSNAHSFSSNPFAAVQSPKDFFLVRLTVVKNTREIVTGKHNVVGSDMGVEEESKVHFAYQKVKKGVYTVTMDTPLPPGEYGFMFSSSSMHATMSKIYDFTVQ